MKRYFLISCLSATFLLFNSCARNPVTGKRQVVLMSEEQEIAMGKEADPQIIAQYGLYENAELQSFITQKVSKWPPYRTVPTSITSSAL